MVTPEGPACFLSPGLRHPRSPSPAPLLTSRLHLQRRKWFAPRTGLLPAQSRQGGHGKVSSQVEKKPPRPHVKRARRDRSGAEPLGPPCAVLAAVKRDHSPVSTGQPRRRAACDPVRWCLCPCARMSHLELRTKQKLAGCLGSRDCLFV